MASASPLKGRLLLAIFALPFAGFGSWMAWSLSHMVLDAHAMRSWQAVPATVLSGGYVTHAGEDSNTFKAHAHYRYEIGGRQYQGNRVQLAGFADNIGDYQQTMGRRLERAAASGEPIGVYVNPSAPGQSIVDREIRREMAGFKALFMLVFGGVGVGMLVVAAKAPRTPKANLPEFEAAPWRLNPAWQTAVIRSNSQIAMWAAFLFAAVWNLVSLPVPFLLYEEVAEKDNPIAFIGLLFPLIGIGLIAWAVRRAREWRRFGPTPLTLDPFPGSIGGHVGGTIDTQLPIDTMHRFRLRLSSIHSYETGSGKNRSRSERLIWQDEVLAQVTSGPTGARLSFRFDVPDGLEASDAVPSGDDYHLWRLSLEARLPGTDLDRDFEIPVYRTGRLSRDPGRHGGASPEIQAAFHDEAVRSRVRISQALSGKTLVYPMGEQALGNLAAILIGVAFAAAGAWLALNEGRPAFGSLFGAAGVLVAAAGAYAAGRSLQVRLEGDRIVSVRRWLGLPLGRRSLHRGDFVRFETVGSLQTPSSNNGMGGYRICGIDRNGERIVLGENFASDGEARAATRFLERELGLRERDTDVSPRLNPTYFAGKRMRER